MGKELPILPASAQPAEAAAPEAVLYSRVFCQKENSPPLRLLIEFLKVMNLMQPPTSLFHPRTVWHVLRSGRTQRAAQPVLQPAAGD